MGTNGQPIFTQPYKTKYYDQAGGSNWSRSPRARNDPQEMRCWGENCEQEKNVRAMAYRQLGIKQRAAHFPPPGQMRNDLPGGLKKKQDTPRSSYQIANECCPKVKNLGMTPLYTEEMQRAVDTKKYNLKKGVGQDYDRSHGDHDLFNQGEKVTGKKKIQMLRAQVQRERQQRKETEARLKSLLDRVGVSPCGPIGGAAPAPAPAPAPARDPPHKAAYSYASPRGDVYVSRRDGPLVTPRDGVTMRVGVVRDGDRARRVLVPHMHVPVKDSVVA